MGDKTAISWTDSTFNSHWGCERVSPGCTNCYAEAFAKRTGNDVWGKRSERRLFGDKHWAEPLKWNRQAEAEGERHRVFCASMGDVFEDRRDLDPVRGRLWALIAETPWLDWQLLTKRPQNVAGMAPWGDDWPGNVWLGTTVEDQQRANERMPILLTIPAKVRFLSCEPLLSAVDLGPELAGLQWVICGGESGGKRRPFDLAWARSLRDQCAEAGVAYFFKQIGALRPGQPGPDDLMVRQFPHPVETAVDN